VSARPASDVVLTPWHDVTLHVGTFWLCEHDRKTEHHNGAGP
jgi:hypothetical protein